MTGDLQSLYFAMSYNDYKNIDGRIVQGAPSILSKVEDTVLVIPQCEDEEVHNALLHACIIEPDYIYFDGRDEADVKKYMDILSKLGRDEIELYDKEITAENDTSYLVNTSVIQNRQLSLIDSGKFMKQLKEKLGLSGDAHVYDFEYLNGKINAMGDVPIMAYDSQINLSVTDYCKLYEVELREHAHGQLPIKNEVYKEARDKGLFDDLLIDKELTFSETTLVQDAYAIDLLGIKKQFIYMIRFFKGMVKDADLDDFAKHAKMLGESCVPIAVLLGKHSSTLLARHTDLHFVYVVQKNESEETILNDFEHNEGAVEIAKLILSKLKKSPLAIIKEHIPIGKNKKSPKE